MQIQSAGNDQSELEQSEAIYMRSLAYFSWWHAGWVITEFSTHLPEKFSLPAFFQNMDWDSANKDLMLHMYPTGSEIGTPPCLVQMAGVIDVQMHILSFCRPMRLLHIHMETGETTVVRLELHLDQRSAYEQIAGRCSDHKRVCGQSQVR